MIFDFIEKFKGLFADKSKYGDKHISMGRNQEYLNAVNTIAVGYEVDANGNYSTALGTGTEVNYENQVVIGKYNFKRNSNYAFIIGNGTDDNNRSNALEVSWNGNLDVYRDLYVNGWIQSTKGIQSGQSIQSAIDVTCTGEGGVGTVSLRNTAKNKIGTRVNLSSYNSETNMYTFPCDGYVYMSGEKVTSGSIKVPIYGSDMSKACYCYMNITGEYQIQSTFVRKGMKCWVLSQQSNTSVEFLPLI